MRYGQVTAHSPNCLGRFGYDAGQCAAERFIVLNDRLSKPSTARFLPFPTRLSRYLRGADIPCDVAFVRCLCIEVSGALHPALKEGVLTLLEKFNSGIEYLGAESELARAYVV